MKQSVEPGFDISARTAPGQRFGLIRVGFTPEEAAVSSSLQNQKRPHAELLEMAIRWEALRAEYFGVTQQQEQVEACLNRQHRLEQTLEQARAGAAIAAEQRTA